jgi:translation initiation factor 6
VQDCEVVGALVAANSNGIIVGGEVDAQERTTLEAIAPLTVVSHRQNAMGNNILANDAGALVHPEFSDAALANIGRALKVPVERGTVAGLGTVGMAGVATNRGVVLHPRATEKEAALVGDLLKVPVHRSTANFGVPIVGACIVANSKGIIVGRPTTPVEVVHLQEGLDIFD